MFRVTRHDPQETRARPRRRVHQLVLDVGREEPQPERRLIAVAELPAAGVLEHHRFQRRERGFARFEYEIAGVGARVAPAAVARSVLP